MGKCRHLIPEAEQAYWNSEKENSEDLDLPKAWVELHITDGQKGRYPSGLRRDIKKACPCCTGIKRWGKYRDQAFCEQINTASHASEYGKDVHFFMDISVTNRYCLNDGIDCPLRPKKKFPWFYAVFDRKEGW